MGLKFRKSINLGGGFKINLSKSGIGYSWGTKGVRFTKTASGKKRTTLGIPGTGISYTTKSGGKRTPNRTSPKATNNFSAPSPDNSNNEERNPWIMFIICACFGYIGVHKFMEKKNGMGILYCFTLGLFGVGWIIDCIRYLTLAVKNSRVEKLESNQTIKESGSPIAQFLSVETPKLLKPSVKKALLWVLTGFLGLFALALLPHLSGIIFLVTAALVAPIEKWQNILSQFVKGKVKTIAVVVMAVLALLVTPTANAPETDTTDPSTVVVETSEMAMVAPTKNATEPPVEVERISFDNKNYVIGVGRTVEIPFTLYPENAKSSALKVSIDNGENASVSFGKEEVHMVQVTGIIPGEEEIILSAGESVTATKTITVVEVMPEEITIVAEPQKIQIGDSGFFAAEFNPLDVTKQEVIWQSDAPDVIKVNEDGSFEAVSIGEAMITATHENGVSGILRVEVFPVEAKTITLSTNWEEGKHFCKNDSMILTAVITPENTADKSVTWTSNNEAVATVSDTGVVQAIYPGTAVITAKATNGVTETYEVTVDISPQKFYVSATIYIQSNDHVGNSWSVGFEFNDEEIYSGSVVSVMPGETFTACGWAQDNDSKPERGNYRERLTLDEEMCKTGFTIEGEANVYENGGRYRGHCATWYVQMVFTPIG